MRSCESNLEQRHSASPPTPRRRPNHHVSANCFRRLPQSSPEASANGVDDRSPEDVAIFERALPAMSAWYGHARTHVLLVDTDLPAYAKNTQPYAKRGWCLMEYHASGIVKDADLVISLRKLSGTESSLGGVIETGRAFRAPPMAPAAFAVLLQSGSESGEVYFAYKRDAPLVVSMYDTAFMTELTKANTLHYQSLGWHDAQGVALCEALRYAHAHGALQELKKLYLNSNQLGDEFVKLLVALLDKGGLANLETLALFDNAITNAGMLELANAIARGGLPRCWGITLRGNPGSPAPVKQAIAQRTNSEALSA